MITKNLLFMLSISSFVLYSSDRFPHPSSYPYLTGDTLRANCTFILDDSTVDLTPQGPLFNFDPKAVQEGDTIFISIYGARMINFLDFFFTYLDPLIEHRYILVYHNSDHPVPGRCAHYLDNKKLIAFFALNPDTQHPKLIPVPLALARKLTEGRHEIRDKTTVFDELTQDFSALCHKKDKLLYMNFSLDTHPSRKDVFEFFKDKTFCSVATVKPFADYLREMAEYKFVLSPQGAGIDCHKTWEALLLGCVPIVKTSSIDSLYNGLPVIIVKDWEEITQEFLENKWQEMLPFICTYNREKLYAPYWLNLMYTLGHQNNYPYERKKL